MCIFNLANVLQAYSQNASQTFIENNKFSDKFPLVKFALVKGTLFIYSFSSPQAIGISLYISIAGKLGLQQNTVLYASREVEQDVFLKLI